MPRLACGLATRTHGVRPSEETAFRVISGSFPLRRLIGPSTPAEGRAPHARNDGTTPTQVLSSLGHRPLARPSVIMTCLGLRQARICGRGDRAPPRKTPSALSPALPQGHLALAHPPGGAGSARPQ